MARRGGSVRPWLLLALLALLAACAGGIATFEAVQRRAESEVRSGGLVGVALAAERDGRRLWEAGLGLADVEAGAAATPDTPFSLASVSKPFTATALMVLAERGEVDLDGPVNDYLGTAKLRGPPQSRYEPTLRDIAGHVGGLGLHYHFFPVGPDTGPPPMVETIRRFGFLVAPPGERYQYSNLGYGVLEHVIERVSGRSYADFLRAEVLEPLGLDRTSVPSGRRAGLAERYWDDGSAVPFYDFDHRGGSAVYSSVRDLVRFGRFHLGLLDLGEKAPVSPAGRAEMQRTVARWGSAGYGLGWTLTNLTGGTRVVAHGGGMPGVRTFLSLFPDEGVVLALVANRGGRAAARLYEELRSVAVPGYREAEGAAPEAVFAGSWSGAISSADGGVPLTLWLRDHLRSEARIDGGEVLPVHGVRVEDGAWTGSVAARLDLPELRGLDHDLHLVLRRRGARLSGRATAIGRPAPGRMPSALSFPAELKLASDFAPPLAGRAQESGRAQPGG